MEAEIRQHEAQSRTKRSWGVRLRRRLVRDYQYYRRRKLVLLMSMAVGAFLSTVGSEVYKDIYSDVKVRFDLFSSKISLKYSSPRVPQSPTPSSPGLAQIRYTYSPVLTFENDGYRDGNGADWTVAAPENCTLTDVHYSTVPEGQAAFMEITRSKQAGTLDLWHVGFFPKNLKLMLVYSVSCTEKLSTVQLHVSVSRKDCAPHEVSRLWLRPLDLPAPGTYTLSIAMGDAGYPDRYPSGRPVVVDASLSESARDLEFQKNWARFSRDSSDPQRVVVTDQGISYIDTQTVWKGGGGESPEPFERLPFNWVMWNELVRIGTDIEDLVPNSQFRYVSTRNNIDLAAAYSLVSPCKSLSVGYADTEYFKPLRVNILKTGGAHIRTSATTIATTYFGRGESTYCESELFGPLTVRILSSGGAHLVATVDYRSSKPQESVVHSITGVGQAVVSPDNHI